MHGTTPHAHGVHACGRPSTENACLSYPRLQAPFAPEHKQAPKLGQLLTAVHLYLDAQQATMQLKPDSTAQGASPASSSVRKRDRFKSQLPANLSRVVLGEAPNGQVTVHLIVTASTPPAGIPTATHKQAAAAWAAELQSGLETALNHAAGHPCAPAVKALRGSGRASVTLCVPDMAVAVGWLLQQDTVQHAGVQNQVVKQDLLAVSTVQAGGLPKPLVDVRTQADTSLPLWSAGLDGRGQIVGVADTGLDMDSCYVFDPKCPNITADPSALVYDPDADVLYYSLPQHRKVAAYILGNKTDVVDVGGHGTHTAVAVAGSVAGFNPTGDVGLATGAWVHLHICVCARACAAHCATGMQQAPRARCVRVFVCMCCAVHVVSHGGAGF